MDFTSRQRVFKLTYQGQHRTGAESDVYDCVVNICRCRGSQIYLGGSPSASSAAATKESRSKASKVSGSKKCDEPMDTETRVQQLEDRWEQLNNLPTNSEMFRRLRKFRMEEEGIACLSQTWNWVIGSPGQWVIWVIFHVRVTGSPGHHFDPV